MKILFFPLILIAAFFVYQEFKSEPASAPAPPPPPPPAILSEPAPVISEAEQAKILRSTDDQDPNVRWEAVLLLNKMKSPQAVQVVYRMLQKDLEPSVRIKAIGLLSDRQGSDVLNALADALRDQETEVRLAALRALEKIGDYSIASTIASGPLKDREESVRLQAIKTLNALQDNKQAKIEAAQALYEREKQNAGTEKAKKRWW